MELAYKSATGDPPFLVQNECDSSPFDDQLILMKDDSMGTEENGLKSRYFLYNGHL